MADVTQRFPVGWSDGSTPSISKNPALTGTVAAKVEVTLVAGAITDQLLTVAFDKDTLKGVLISVEDNDLATVTIETNATDHAGGDIFIFPIGGGELYWTNRFPSEVAQPFSADVTKMYLTKSATADTPTVRVRALTGP